MAFKKKTSIIRALLGYYLYLTVIKWASCYLSKLTNSLIDIKRPSYSMRISNSEY